MSKELTLVSLMNTAIAFVYDYTFDSLISVGIGWGQKLYCKVKLRFEQ